MYNPSVSSNAKFYGGVESRVYPSEIAECDSGNALFVGGMSKDRCPSLSVSGTAEDSGAGAVCLVSLANVSASAEDSEANVKVCNAEDRSAKSVSAFAEDSGATSRESVNSAKGETFKRGGVLERAVVSARSFTWDWKFRESEESFQGFVNENSGRSVTGKNI